MWKETWRLPAVIFRVKKWDPLISQPKNQKNEVKKTKNPTNDVNYSKIRRHLNKKKKKRGGFFFFWIFEFFSRGVPNFKFYSSGVNFFIFQACFCFFFSFSDCGLGRSENTRTSSKKKVPKLKISREIELNLESQIQMFVWEIFEKVEKLRRHSQEKLREGWHATFYFL